MQKIITRKAGLITREYIWKSRIQECSTKKSIGYN
jgi:hypothetical protein